MSIKLNAEARRMVLIPTMHNYQDINNKIHRESATFKLGVYSSLVPSVLPKPYADGESTLPEIGKLGEFSVNLRFSSDKREIYLDANYAVTTALRTGRVRSWVLQKDNAYYFATSGYSVATQSSGIPANLILNSLDSVEGEVLQLVDFSVRVN